MSSGVSPGSHVAQPALIVTRRPATGRLPTLARRRSAVASAPVSSTSGSRTRNSSPPQRPAKSSSRSTWTSRAATRASTASPRAWPCSSLIDLKRSMSTRTSDRVRSWRVELRTSADSCRTRKRRLYRRVSSSEKASSSRPRSRSSSWSRSAAPRAAARTREIVSASGAGQRRTSSTPRAWARSTLSNSSSPARKTTEVRNRSGSPLIEASRRSGPSMQASSSTIATSGFSSWHSPTAARTSSASTVSASIRRSVAASAERTSGSLWAMSTFTRSQAYPHRVPEARALDICSGGQTGAEADGVAGHAVADAQVQHPGGVAAVLDDRMGAGMVDRDRGAVDHDLAVALEDGPDRPRLVGPRVGAGLVGRGDGDERVRVVLGVHRRDGLAVVAEQLLDGALGLRVGALPVVEVDQPQLLVEEVARRPPRVLVEVPDLHVGVEQDRVLDAQPRDGLARGGVVARGREAGRVHADDAQPGGRVALVPGLDVRQRAQRAGAAEVPELDQHGTAELLVDAQHRDVDPVQPGRERRGGDAVDGWAHGTRRYQRNFLGSGLFALWQGPPQSLPPPPNLAGGVSMRKFLAIAAALVAVLALAAVAFAQQVNKYSVTASTNPARAGSKAKPAPVSVKFNYKIDEASGQQPSAVKRYKISLYGVRENGQFFKTCAASKISAAGNNDASCPKAALVGSGTLQNYVYQSNNPSGQGGFPCNKKLHIWNAGKRKAVLFIYGDPSQCGGVGSLPPISAKYVAGEGGGTALQFDVPPTVLHPIAGLTVAVRSVQSTITRKTVTRKGKKVGYYESVKCSGSKRPVTVTFTPESGATAKASTSLRCAK